MLYGISPVMQCLLAGRRACERLYVKTGVQSPALRRIVALARQRGVAVEAVSPQRLGNLAQDRHHQGVVLVCGELPTLDLGAFLDDASSESALVVALDQVQDPQNLGAIIRTAAFLGAAAVLTLSRNSAPLSAATSKASAGAMERFPIIRVGNLAEALERCCQTGYMVVGTDAAADSTDFRKAPKSKRVVLVLGNEGEGLRALTRKRCDLIVTIPGRPNTESLNVNAAAAILIQHFVAG